MRVNDKESERDA